MLGFRLKLKEPKDPPLITKFMDKVKKSGVYKMSFKDRFKEKAIHEAKKKLEGSKLEDRLKGRAKEVYREKRLKKKRATKTNNLFPRVEDI